MLALLGSALMQPTKPAICIGGLCDTERLKPFLQRLRKARGAGRPVRILQIGDSHTAGDQITGSWRTLLQARYGSGGRGTMPPGRPYQGYLTRGITARQSDGWSVAGIFGTAYKGTGVNPIGLSGYSASTDLRGASMSLQANDVELFDRFTVCAMRGPGAGTLALTIATTTMTWELADGHIGADCKSVETDTATDSAQLAVVTGPVTLTSWATERRGSGGVTVSNLGTVGAQFVHFERTDDAVVRREIEEYSPDLIVIAFGTNEAFRPDFSAAAYDIALQSGIRRIQRLAPGIPILLLGAPDSATKLAALQTGSVGVSTACIAAHPLPPLNAMVTPMAAADPVLPAAGSEWRPTAALPVVQSIGHARAYTMGVAYWDWSIRMGGRCTANTWVHRQPPLMRGDHVHFTTPGASIIAGLLEQDIEAAIADLDTSTISGPQ